MKMKKILGIFVLAVIAVGIFILFPKTKNTLKRNNAPTIKPVANLNPLSIAALRGRSYPGSTITIEKQLLDGEKYHQYLVSYLSDGLKIYALLTVPLGQKPTTVWPVILFNHGYIPPDSYQTAPSVGQYASYI